MNKLSRRAAPLALAALFVSLAAALACRSGAEGRGQLRVALVDAPNPDVTEIWVNVTAVRAHEVGAGWFGVSDVPVRIDLLKLKDHALDLGLANLPPGTITQIRLVVAESGNTVMVAGAEAPLKVPSGPQSGIKIKGPWTISECTETVVTLDFDGEKSIWYHPTAGGAGEWILRPVIRTKSVVEAPGTCEPGETCDPAQCPSGVCDASGQCGAGGAGAPCDLPEACLSGVCQEGSCAPGVPGDPCRAGTDCAGGACSPEGVCAPAGLPNGSTCNLDSDCLSGACVEGSCAPGSQGQFCDPAGGCAEGFVCIEGGCEPAPAP